MGIFSRLFKVGQAQAHSVINKFEDPIKMTEQGIRDLKKNLKEAMEGLAEVKSLAIRSRRDVEDTKRIASDYEKKAMLLLQKGKDGSLEMAEAERLALESLNKKEELAASLAKKVDEADMLESKAAQIQINVQKLNTTIKKYENDLITLRARAKTAACTKKVNEQLARIDSNGTIAMLEKMKVKVDEDETLAQAYGEMVVEEVSVDDEINRALKGADIKSLEGGNKKSLPSASADRLAELKSKLGM